MHCLPCFCLVRTVNGCQKNPLQRASASSGQKIKQLGWQGRQANKAGWPTWQAGQQGRQANMAGRPTRQAGQQGRLANMAGRPTRQAGQHGRQANKAGRPTRQAGQQGRQACQICFGNTCSVLCPLLVLALPSGFYIKQSNFLRHLWVTIASHSNVKKRLPERCDLYLRKNMFCFPRSQVKPTHCPFPTCVFADKTFQTNQLKFVPPYNFIRNISIFS